MFTNSTRRSCTFHFATFLYLSAAVTLLQTNDGLAQNAPDGEFKNSEDIIVVTGTRIPRPDAQAASPVAVFDRDSITRFGELSVEDFINNFPQATPDFGRTSNNPGDGTASINLRGLGRSRTLVLLNGRRVAPSGTGTAVDINTIPRALINRIELVTGGASAVYGSDAVSGVINFITREDLVGVEASGQFDIYGAGDGETYNASVAAGTYFADERGHISVFGDYLRRSAVLAGAREFTETFIGEDRRTGSLMEFGAFDIPEGSILFPPAFDNGQIIFPVFNQDGSIRNLEFDDLFNFAPFNYLQTPLERWSGGSFARYDLTDAVQLFAEAMYSRSGVDSQLAPLAARFNTPFSVNSAFFTPSAQVLLGQNYDPDGDGVGLATLSKRFSELGPRQFERRSNDYRATLGFNAELSADWSLDGYYSFGRNDRETVFLNAASVSRISQGLLVDQTATSCLDPTGGCVPVNIFGEGNLTDAAVNYISIEPFADRAQSTQHLASLVATGELFTWSQGPVQTSFGVEFRRNSASFSPNEITSTGDAVGFPSEISRAGAINLYEVFSEIVAPLASEQPFAELLEIEAGGRFSHYSTSGSVWTWKAGGQWSPFPGLRFRGSWQRAVRAPNVEELLTQPAPGPSQIGIQDDFCLASNDPIGRGFSDICLAQGIDPSQLGVFDLPAGLGVIPVIRITQGNLDLRPERANTITAGFEYIFDLPFYVRLGADYFNYRITDAISIVDNVLPLCQIERDPNSALCQSVVREPSGLISTVARVPLNLSVARVEGVDFNLELSSDAPNPFSSGDNAEVSLRSLASYYFTYGQSTTENTPFVNCAGGFSLLCATPVGLDRSVGSTFPSTLVTTTLGYGTDRFGVSLQWRWISGLDNFAGVFESLAGRPDPILAIPTVDARNYLDVAFNFNLRENARLTFGVDNVLATDPPLLAFESPQANTDPSRYDVLGRRVFVALQVEFGSR